MEKYVAFRIPESLYNQLAQEAKQEMSSVSRVLRLILTERYKKND
jgi:hypothetical protein